MVTSLVETVLWIGILWVVAVRPWTLDLPGRVPLVQWIGLGACLLWWIKRRHGFRNVPPHMAVSCLIVFLAFLLSSSLGHDRQELFIQGHGLVFGIVLCASVALASHRQHQQVRWILVLTGTLLAGHALWQGCVLFPALANVPWERLALESPVKQIPLHTIAYATEVIQRRRVFGPFPLPGLLAAALVVLLPLSVATLRPWATTSVRRGIALVVWGLQAAALLLTQSLAGLLSAGAATWLVLVLRRRALRTTLIVLAVTIISVGLLLVRRPELSDLRHPRNPIVQRWRYWSSTVHMIHDHPLRGLGAGNYSQAYPFYRRPLATDTRFAHNAFLHVWAEWGLLGAVGVVGLLIGAWRLSTHQPVEYQIAVVAFWLMALIDVAWSFAQVSSLWWVLAGLLMIPARIETTPGAPRPASGAS